MNDRYWNRLLRGIEDSNVIPVIGSQLSLLRDDCDNAVTLQRLMATRLLEVYEIDAETPRLQEGRELNDAVCRIIARNGRSINFQDLYPDIVDLYNQISQTYSSRLPAPLEQLAAIADFRLFVTVSIDTLFATALRKHCAVKEIVHAPRLSASEKMDLDEGWQNRAGEAELLYLFGKPRSHHFAIHDEDTLEFAHNLLSGGPNVPTLFLDELRSRNILLIGCNFPEWLSRFFFRLTSKARLTEQATRDWLVDDIGQNKELAIFLDNFGRQIEVISSLPPDAFVKELYHRWTTRRSSGQKNANTPAGGSSPDLPGVMFFISYARDCDATAAHRLHEVLISLGVASRQIWFDTETLEPGNEFQERISAGIKQCSYFIPLISKKGDEFVEKFFRREWRDAIDRSKSIATGRDFVIPIIVDDKYEPKGYKHVPPEWKENIDFGHAPGGEPNSKLIKKLTDLIRTVRSEDRQ